MFKPRTGMIRAVFFDVGNVVLYFSHQRMCRQLAAATGAASEAVRREIFDSGFAVRYDRGEVDTRDFVARLEGLAGRRLDPALVRQAACEIFSVNSGVAAVIDALARGGVTLGVLSNTCEVHSSYALERFEVFRHLRHRVFSHQVGAVKPEPAIFRAAHQAAGCAPEECFFTDDRPEFTAAARRAGLDAETFRGARYLRRQLARRGLPVDP
ncbi:MAG TPA: HAD family phosphatase [Thermoanaerobaculia bacterium]|nr:HAD family phosphatase [Thermoanaerobaculia bacterium]